MIYILEMLGTEDLENPVRVFKVGYTSNFKKRLAQYKTHNACFKIYKLLEGEDFDRKAEQILHRVLSFFRYKDRPEMFKKTKGTKGIIDSINTAEDLYNLENLIKFLDCRYVSDEDKYFIEYIQWLDHNWDLIQTVYHKKGKDLIHEMLDSRETDLFRYMSNTYGIDINSELPSVEPSKPLQIIVSNDYLSETYSDYIEYLIAYGFLNSCKKVEARKD